MHSTTRTQGLAHIALLMSAAATVIALSACGGSGSEPVAASPAPSPDPSPAPTPPPPVPPPAACGQTVNPGTDLASIVASAPNGSTICLNAGHYGNVNLSNLARTGYATIASTSGTGAIMSPSVGNSRYIRFERMRLTSMLIQNNSTNIQIVNSTFLPNQNGLAIVDSSNILVDGVDFTNVNQATWSGRLSLNNASHTTITNSRFVGVGNSSNVREAAADGIMIVGNANNNTIGPNNIFSNILQNVCDVANPGSHCDAIQFYGAGPNNVINGNYFDSVHTYIMAPDGTENVTVTNNVFNGASVPDYVDKIQFGSAENPRFEHNTLRNVRVSFDSKPGNAATTNAVAQNNLMAAGSSFKTSGGNGCSGCTISNNLSGTPTFVGGANPTTYSGFQLTSSSMGYRAATDGRDMGAIVSASPP